jgi:hydroxyacylglutathione hydrolase
MMRPIAVLAVLVLHGCRDPEGDASTEPGSSGAASTGTSSGGSTASGGSGSTGGQASSSDTTAVADTSTGVGSESDSSDGSSSTGGVRGCDGVFPEHWIDGLDCGSEPEVMVHRYDERTYILRQSLCTSFEGPFLYLMFGDDRVLLEDTGAGGIAIADVVYGVIDDWLTEQGKASIELVVVNSHAHGDHVAGNGQFEGQPNTTVVQPSVAGLSAFFGIDRWPEDVAQYELGDRIIDVIPIPGHQQSHIALFDHRTGMLLTGDTLYPGRLYIDDFTAYVASIGRLVDTVPEPEVCHVMGTHIEMTDMPGVDFDFGDDQHPGEHVLELGWEHLLELRDAVDAMDVPQIEIHDDFIVYPL